MNKQALVPQWDHFRMTLGVTRRMVDQIPTEKIDFRPTPESRSAQEIISHMYTFLTDATKTVAAGKHVQGEEPHFASKAELLTWMDSQVEKSITTFKAITDAQVGAEIECWGQKFSGFVLLSFPFQEHLHHRGQLTVYLRLMGIQPLFIYDL